jgi:hypothetical protein
MSTGVSTMDETAFGELKMLVLANRIVRVAA